MRHVIWDWNGTLFDDFDLLVQAASASSVAVGGPPIDAPTFRRSHVRPLSIFYERLVNRRLEPEEWRAINAAFHDHYGAVAGTAELAIDAVAALDRVATSGATQSLLSMWLHDSLVPFVHTLRIEDYFVRIDGVPAPSDESKVSYMLRHIAALSEELGTTLDAENTTVIGDSADDGLAAREAGVAAVLVPTGVQSADALEATGWPVSESLLHAVEIAGF